MRKRSLESSVDNICFKNHKMAFVSGPRQCGKTTLAKMLLKSRGTGIYYNWDDTAFRRTWTMDPKQIIKAYTGIPVVILDEIHKAKLWKRSVKGLYDTLEHPADILVTGSARLNVYRKGSDSLLGRYYHFRLHPFSLREMTSDILPGPDEAIQTMIKGDTRTGKSVHGHFRDLMEYGGFPEPLFGQNTKMARLWRRNRLERVIREDLRDLTRIPELGRIEMLASLLPERVGSPLSITSLREALEISYDTARRWLEQLCELHYAFIIRPYHRSIARAIKKEPKLYLWDSGEVPGKGPRFENLVACHLLKACHYWSDTGEGDFDLHYLRNKEGDEIDFLITRDKRPWLPVEVKSGQSKPARSWDTFMKYLGCRCGFQVVAAPGIRKTVGNDAGQLHIRSADTFLSCLP